MKTSKLIGPALDWAVAKCENAFFGTGVYALTHFTNNKEMYQYSTDWSRGGPIIEREKIGVEYTSAGCWHAAIEWLDEPSYTEVGPTPLIAAMRCYVASRLGDEVEIPEELL
jgi:hypothetical protein